MTNSTNSAPRYVITKSGWAGHRGFATLPGNAPEILVRDVFDEKNYALVWPYQSLDRRRIFQRIFFRYHRQILFGCKNTNCQTPTCLTYQKKISKRPFRGFTVLSARILAMFLASQDDPQMSLCPHESLAPPEAANMRLIRSIYNGLQSGITAPSSTLGLQSTSSKSTPEPELASFITRKRHPNPKTHNGNVHPDKTSGQEESVDFVEGTTNKLRTGKDPKSFAQNLFDTYGMRLLEECFPEVHLRWLPCYNKVMINSISREGNRGDESVMKDIVRKSKSFHEPDRIECGVTVNTHGDKPVEAAATLREPVSSKQPEMGYGSDEKILPSPENPVVRPVNSTTTSNISRGSNDSSSQEWTIHIQQQFDIKATDNISNQVKNSAREPRAPMEGSDFATATKPRLKSSPDLKHIVDKDSWTNPTRSKAYLDPPQALRMFTLENIVALVDTVSAVHPKLHEENRFLRLLGRTPMPYYLCSIPHWTPSPHERDIAFGAQSIVSILGSTDALLKSFLARAEDGSTRLSMSVGFSEVVHAFQLLWEIDHHPSNIFPCLWISVGKVHIPTNILSRNPFVKTAKSTKSNFSPGDSSFEQEFVNEDVLNDEEAAHIVKIALASLVASVPKHSPDVWFHFQTLRATGSNVPRSEIWYNDKDLPNSLLELMDSFDNEMALSLVIRITRAVTARRCVSKMSKHQETGVREEEKSRSHDNDFMNVIIREILEDDPVGPFSALPVNPEPAKRDFESEYIRITKINNELQSRKEGRRLSVAIIAEWLRSVILREWDGKAEVSRWGAVGSALEFLSSLHQLSASLEIDPAAFYNLSLSERLEIMDMPAEWVTSQQDRNTVHVMSYPFLFIPATLVSFYRAINHAAMFKAFEGSMVAAKLETQMTFVDSNTGRGDLRLHDRLRTATSSYLVLVVRREDVLTDALNQLWRRERRELMRPLKVRMGMNEGEEGVDHGGVQQEFFRVALSESMRPDYGLFITDTQTQMSWFQPCSLEPLYKFELLGLLTSLAVYNGLTLPVTFPLALYRKLLDLPVTELQHIEDGWPLLAKGLGDLLAFEDEYGKTGVEDIFVRSYVFSVEALEKTIYVDMEKIGRDDDWPPFQGSVRDGESEDAQNSVHNGLPLSPPALDQYSSSFAPLADGNGGWIALEASNEPTATHGIEEFARPRTNSITSQARMVTETNRDQYVDDYVFWLTDKSIRPQYEAFARGFYTCLDKKATTIFSPEILKRVVEGTQDIDVDQLQKTASYEGGYHEEHTTITDFWSIVRELPTKNLRQLLEFVTASDRIPVNGISNILFVIQKNGTQDDRLPTSLTCFGRLLLPAYSSREKLKEKLYIAIENSKGFGVA